MQRILGQPIAMEALGSGLRSGRFAHAWIFSGPKGVGKFTTAMELAKMLLDPEWTGGDLEPKPDTRSTRLIEAAAHADLHVIRKELAQYSENPTLRARKLLNIPIDLLRERLIGGQTSDGRYHEAPAYMTPVLGHAKVFIIDEAELIDANGQNALLKTLEEPPPRTYLILVTSQPQRLLPTIHSRCQHVQFIALGKAAMDEWFKRAGLDVSDADRDWIEQFSDGSPGLAQIAARYSFYEWPKELDPMLAGLARGRFPARMGETLAKQVEEFAVDWVEDHHNASKDAANKDGARYLLSFLAGHARRQLAEDLKKGDDPTPRLAVIDLIREAERELAANVNLKLLLENLVVQWAQPPAAAPAS